MNWNRRRLALVLALLTAALLVCGCAKQRAPSDTVPTANGAETVEPLAIETPRGTLYMPDLWKDCLKSEIAQDGSSVRIIAVLESGEYPLFDVFIREDAADSEGTVRDANGKDWNVAVDLLDLTGVEQLSPEQQDQLYAMQEDVNFLISQLDS